MVRPSVLQRSLNHILTLHNEIVRKGSQTVGELNVDGLEYEEAYGRIEDALYDAIQRGEQKLRVTVALTENKISQRRHPLMVRLAE